MSAMEQGGGGQMGGGGGQMGGQPYGGPGYGYSGPPMGWGGGYGYSRGMMRPQFPIETKPFFLTSEFWGTVALIVGLAIAAGTSDTIDARLFWQLATVATVFYVISRGIAKSGTKSRSWDPRDDMMEKMRDRGND